jgi:hypothetical protein
MLKKEVAMGKFVQVIVPLLVMLLLPGCDKEQPSKPAEEKSEQTVQAEKKAKDLKAKLETEQAEKKAKNLEAELEAKLRIEYEKRFGTPITDFELSTKSVEYRYRLLSSTDDYPEISITRTATGAIAKYKNDALELELSIGEWLDFVNALHKCDIKGKNNYSTNYKDYIIYNNCYINFNCHNRGLKILSSSSEELKFIFSRQYDYSDWADFIKLIETMITRVKKEGSAKLEAKLKAEYEKRFGMPMTDFELSIEKVNFQYYLGKSPYRLVITATRTTRGARIKYFSYEKNLADLDVELDLEFDIGEWLDIVNALRKCRIDKWKTRDWKTKYRDNWHKEGFVRWNLNVDLLNKDSFYENWLSFNYGNGYPPNWDEFKKTMDDLAEKIREKAEISKK